MKKIEKPLNDNFNFSDEVVKDQPVKQNLSKFEYDLYHDEDDVIMPVLRVKYLKSSSGEKWKFYQDTKLVFTLEGAKLNKKEKQFLYSPEGFNTLLQLHKNGQCSLAYIKQEIKNNLTSKNP